MPFIKLNKNERKKLLVILTCAMLAVLAWFFMALSSKYIYTAKTVMVYKHFPSNRAFHPLQSDTVLLKVEGTGWQLVFARLRVKPQYVNVNLTKLSTQNFVVLSGQLADMNRQFVTPQRIISAFPDTLYFDFSRSLEKKVPVRLVSSLKFIKQYGLSDAIALNPEYVTVRGPQEALKKLKYWDTDSLKLDKIDHTAVLRIPLARNNIKNISIYPANVEISVPVEEFTEKTIEIPLKIYNNKDFYDVALYPKKISVTFLVALSAYKQVDEDFIEAGIDLNDWKVRGYNKFQVKLTRFPDYCKLVKIRPSIVDFIIEK